MSGSAGTVRALVAAEHGWRAAYVWRDAAGPRGTHARKAPVVGWAVCGDGAVRAVAVWPDVDNAVGFVVGGPRDPYPEHLVAVCAPGEVWHGMPGADARLREVFKADALYMGEPVAPDAPDDDECAEVEDAPKVGTTR